MTEQAGYVEVIERPVPDAPPYRPRKLVAHPVGDDYDETVGVVVFGTHDAVRAQPLADEAAAEWADAGYCAVKPRRVWWRSRIEYGHRLWVDDPERGRAGVRFDFEERES